MTTEKTQNEKLLTFKSGGWIILLASLFCLGTLLVHLYRGLNVGKHQVLNGFDLSEAKIDRQYVAELFKRDGFPSLIEPRALSREQIREQWGKKYLVDTDLVLGFVYNGEARAYPLRVLNWHEIVNDQFGDLPVAITYNPIARSAIAFDRRVGGRPITLRHSGLAYNSNLLMYDRDEESGETSLWYQMTGEAVQGRHTGNRLRRLTCTLTDLKTWMGKYPDSLIIPGMPSLLSKCYVKDYTGYMYLEKKIKYPVTNKPPADGIAPFAPVAVVTSPRGKHTVFPYYGIKKQAGGSKTWLTDVDGVPVKFTYIDPAFEGEWLLFTITRKQPESVLVEFPDGESLPLMHTFYFGWYAATHQTPATQKPSPTGTPVATPTNQ